MKNLSGMDAETPLTSHQVSGMLHVNPSSVNKWIEDGLLTAHRTPGGHRRIKVGDLVQFVQAHKMPLPKSVEHLARRRLLIVDDDAKLLKAVERSLKRYEHRVDVRTTTNGIDALVQVGRFNPHVVVLDVYMPELDGLEVCKRLKESRDNDDVDVVITSAQQRGDMAKKASSAGAKGWMPKPFAVGELLAYLGIREEPQAQATAR